MRSMPTCIPKESGYNLDTVVQNKKNTITNVDFIEDRRRFHMAGVVAGLVTTDTSIPGAKS